MTPLARLTVRQRIRTSKGIVWTEWQVLRGQTILKRLLTEEAAHNWARNQTALDLHDKLLSTSFVGSYFRTSSQRKP